MAPACRRRFKPRIFDEFFTTRRDSGGSGLGMHLVKKLATDTLHGDISVDSQPGQGSCFTLRLPLDQTQD